MTSMRDKIRSKGHKISAVRNSKADAWVDKLTDKVGDLFVRLVNRIIARGKTSEKDAEKFAKEMTQALLPIIVGMMVDAYHLPTLNAKSLFDIWTRARKPSTAKVIHQVQPSARKWLEKISESTADNLVGRMSKIIDNLNKQAQEKGESTEETAKKLKKRLTKLGEDISIGRARSIARTASIWSYNAGVEQSFVDAGIEYKQWFATEDDALCPFCMALDGAVVAVGDAFLPEGESLTVVNDKGKTRTMDPPPGGVFHPPLHPNCRCSVLAAG